MHVAGSDNSDDHEGSIRALFDQWNNALQTRNPEEVVRLYATNAILLPTVSNKVRRTHAEIEDYFAGFLARGPSGTINESDVRWFGDIAIHSGIYTFSFTDKSQLQARFTYVYRWDGAAWQIIQHHSSQMPEG